MNQIKTNRGRLLELCCQSYAVRAVAQEVPTSVCLYVRGYNLISVFMKCLSYAVSYAVTMLLALLLEL